MLGKSYNLPNRKAIGDVVCAGKHAIFISPESAFYEYQSKMEKQQCQVCKNQAAGFHHGAFVCEACKKFFKRYSQNSFKNASTCQENCNLDKVGRRKCSDCRYKKCLQVGMKLTDLTTDKSMIDISKIPCRVCGGKSSGFHFGSLTCEGCKGFFRRTLPNGDRGEAGNGKDKFSCITGKKDCIIHVSNRIMCKFCRYQQCISVGMSRVGSRIGRQPNAVKYQCAMEISARASHNNISTNNMNNNNNNNNNTNGSSIMLKEAENINITPVFTHINSQMNTATTLNEHSLHHHHHHHHHHQQQQQQQQQMMPKFPPQIPTVSSCIVAVDPPSTPKSGATSTSASSASYYSYLSQFWTEFMSPQLIQFHQSVSDAIGILQLPLQIAERRALLSASQATNTNTNTNIDTTTTSSNVTTTTTTTTDNPAFIMDNLALCRTNIEVWDCMMRHFDTHAQLLVGFAKRLPRFCELNLVDRRRMVQESMYSIVLLNLALDCTRYNIRSGSFESGGGSFSNFTGDSLPPINYFDFTASEYQIILGYFPELSVVMTHVAHVHTTVRALNITPFQLGLLCVIQLYRHSDKLESSEIIKTLYDQSIRLYWISILEELTENDDDQLHYGTTEEWHALTFLRQLNCPVDLIEPISAKIYPYNFCRLKEKLHIIFRHLSSWLDRFNHEHQSIIDELKQKRPELPYPELYIEMFQLS